MLSCSAIFCFYRKGDLAKLGVDSLLWGQLSLHLKPWFSKRGRNHGRTLATLLTTDAYSMRSTRPGIVSLTPLCIEGLGPATADAGPKARIFSSDDLLETEDIQTGIGFVPYVNTKLPSVNGNVRKLSRWARFYRFECPLFIHILFIKLSIFYHYDAFLFLTVFW